MIKKNILLLGNSSFTGSHILHNLYDHYSFTRVGRDADLCDVSFDVSTDDISSIDGLLSDADVVINCFSNGDVDSCEVNPNSSRRINLEFPKEICNAQKKHDFHLIHFSSNAVYDGDNPLYSETSDQLPVNVYGKQKSELDQYLNSNSPKYTLFRPITMFGQQLAAKRQNPFPFFLDRLLENKDIVAVDDVYVNMLHVDDLVHCIAKSIDDSIYGDFNISGDDIVNRYEFVSMIKNSLPDCSSTIKKVSSSEFKTAARRPMNTSFDNSKMKSILAVHPQNLSATIGRLVKQSMTHKGSTTEGKHAA